MTAQLQVAQLNKNFASPRGDVRALDGVSFSVFQDEFVCIVGTSGCGKSTLLRLIAGLTEPTGGSVNFFGWSAARRRAMVFQDTGLFAWLNILDNVAFGLEAQGIAQNERHRRARALIARMGLDDFARHYPHELSGGMKQRVAIARALVTEPAILLMDEPFRTLDAQTRLILQDELLRLWSARPMLVLFVTHDIEEAILLGNSVMVLSRRPGHILAEINVPLEQPRHLIGRGHPEIESLRWQIWKMIEPTVQANLERVPLR